MGDNAMSECQPVDQSPSTTKNLRENGFVDFAPIDDVNIAGTYDGALNFALESQRIRNIAVTGPYGAGKTSIIRTFSKKRSEKILHLSLASFTSSAKDDPEVLSQVERSILQQMMYGTDSSALPCSRLTRISPARQPIIKSIVVALWIVNFLLCVSLRTLLWEFGSFTSELIIPSLLIGFSMALPILAISDIYQASARLSFKRFSLKKFEIETVDQKEASVLNEYLDEILYFFIKTNYKLVIIEDLDRFNSSSIFVKLRELNSIINDRRDKATGPAGFWRRLKSRFGFLDIPAKFIYALKDSMFDSMDRTKFFDFIIPIIPVVNSSNSLEKMRNRISGIGGLNICDQFIREVSLYLDDLRLIHNIFNEFSIYLSRLKSDKIDPTRLLAMIIYKNAYPLDFERLHHGEGNLMSAANMKQIFVRDIRKDLREEEEALSAILNNANAEIASDVNQVIDSYIGRLVLRHSGNHPVWGIRINGNPRSLNSFPDISIFQDMADETSIILMIGPAGTRHPVHDTKMSFSELEEAVNPHMTFQDRQRAIEAKSDEKCSVIKKRLRQISAELSKLHHMPLFEGFKRSGSSIESCFITETHQSNDLIIYLLSNRYIDDTYCAYISEFHEGRLSQRDRDFLLMVRNYQFPDPAVIIDNPDEVCKNLRLADFRHRYVLNISLIDHLFDSTLNLLDPRSNAIQVMAESFDESEEFLTIYLAKGSSRSNLLKELTAAWPEFSLAAVSSRFAVIFISHLLSRVDHDYIVNSMNKDGVLSSFIGDNAVELFCMEDHLFRIDYGILSRLGVQIRALSSIHDNRLLMDTAHIDGLYHLTQENISLILERYSDIPHELANAANCSDILEYGTESLRELIDRNLRTYVVNTLIPSPVIRSEKTLGLRALLQSDKLAARVKFQLIQKSKCCLPDFEGVPIAYWSKLMSNHVVFPNWNNVAEYCRSDVFEQRDLVIAFESAEFLEKLLGLAQQVAEFGANRSEQIWSRIAQIEDLSDDSYSSIMKLCPHEYQRFPVDTLGKRIALAESCIVVLAEESFGQAAAGSMKNVMSLLVQKNFQEFQAQPEVYAISSEVRELLLQSELGADGKIVLCNDLADDEEWSLKLLGSVARLGLQSPAACRTLRKELVRSAALNCGSPDDAIAILIGCVASWPRAFFFGVLSMLGPQYGELTICGKKPKLQRNELNEELLLRMRARRWIGVVRRTGQWIRVHNLRKPRD